MMKDLISSSKEEFAHLDPHGKWEMIKIKIREATQQYSRRLGCINKQNRCKLEQELNILENIRAENPTDNDICKEIAHIKQKLEVFSLAKTKGAQIRSKMKWIEDGEKNGRYFLSLEKMRAVGNTVYSIKIGETEKFDSLEILKEITQYY